jgi:thiol-disulfide isomerase/thioredoxin
VGRKIGWIGLALIGAALLAAAASAWTWTRVARDGPALSGDMRKFELLPAPRPVPEIAFTTLAGEPTGLADFRGRIVLLNLWATWCGPCVEEMPSLERLQGKLGGDTFTVLALSSDRAGARVVEPFLEKLGLSALKPYLDPRGAATRALGVRGLPTTLLLDREGRELGRLEGAAQWDGPAALALLRHYLAPPPRDDDLVVKTRAPEG